MSTRTIWKFTVPVADSQTIRIKGAEFVEFLDAKMSPSGDHEIDLWAIVDSHSSLDSYAVVEMRGTGHPLHDERLAGSFKEAHIATLADGGLIWHVFQGWLRS